MAMFLEILIGVGGGYFLQPLYYDYIFVPYPETRLALFSILPPLVLTAVLAWVVDTLWQFLTGFRNPLRRQGPFWNHALGASLFFSGFIHIQAMKIGTELHLPILTTPPTAAVCAALLAWCWVRACHYRLMMAHLPELLPSMQLAESAARISGKAPEKPGAKTSERKGLFGKRTTEPQSSAGRSPEKRPRNDESLKAVRGAFERQFSSAPKKSGKRQASPSIFRAMK